MKIFICTDLHGQGRILVEIDRYLDKNKFDAVFMLGDLCDGNDPRCLAYAHNFIDVITKKHKIPLYVVHGNQESEAVRLLYQQNNVSVSFNLRKLGDYDVVGVGYGDVFPVDPEFANDKILLTHEPPRASMIREMVKKQYIPNSPLVHLAGHLHNKETVYEIGQTTLSQVPTAQKGRGAILEMPSQKIKFISFNK